MRLERGSIAPKTLRLLFAGGAFFMWVAGGTGPAAADTPLNRCTACHEVRDGDTVIIKGGRLGPNLYGVIGRTAGLLDGYRYSDDLVAAGQAGLVYDRETLAAFIANPNAFLSNFSGQNARSKMPLGFPQDAEAATAYLARISGALHP